MKVINYVSHTPTDREKYVAEFDVEGLGTEKGSLILRRFRLVQGKNGHFISWPAYPVMNDDGESKRYVQFFDFGIETKKKMDAEMHEQIKLLTAETPF